MPVRLTMPVRLGMQIAFGRVRRKTAPTGPGENIELPKYFLKLHETPPAKGGVVVS